MGLMRSEPIVIVHAELHVDSPCAATGQRALATVLFPVDSAKTVYVTTEMMAMTFARVLIR